MARIGKYVIDSLTRSMYEDSRCIYREYIQNAADQIDIAKEQHLEEHDYYEIHVRIFRRCKCSQAGHFERRGHLTEATRKT